MAAVPVVAGFLFALSLFVSWLFRGEEVRYLRRRLAIQSNRESATVGHLQGELKRLQEENGRLKGVLNVRAMQ